MSNINAPMPTFGYSEPHYVDVREGMCFQDAQGRWFKFNGWDGVGGKVWVPVVNPPTCSRSDAPFESVR